MEENKINAPETVGSPSEEPTSSAPCPLNAPVSRGKKVGTFFSLHEQYQKFLQTHFLQIAVYVELQTLP